MAIRNMVARGVIAGRNVGLRKGRLGAGLRRITLMTAGPRAARMRIVRVTLLMALIVVRVDLIVFPVDARAGKDGVLYSSLGEL